MSDADPNSSDSSNSHGSEASRGRIGEPEFAIRFDRDEDSKTPNRLRPPPNYQSTKVRVQLMVLVFAFLLVLVLMNEARKPENWAWMGFDDNKTSTSALVENRTLGASQFSNADPTGVASADPNSRPQLGEGDPLSPTSENADREPLSRSTYESWHEGLWQRLLRELTPSDLRHWVALWLDRSSTPLASSEKPDRWQPIVESLDQRLNQELTDESEALNKNTQATAAQMTWPANSLRDWQKTRDVLSSATIPPNDPNTSFPTEHTPNRWLERLWSVSIDAVEDRTEMTRLADGPAWLLAWHRVQRDTQTNAPEVTHYSLMSQPTQYRGKPVRIVGELRGIESIQVPRNELGIERYYALWIKPPGAGTLPYCVYASELPGNISPPAHGWSDVKLPIAVNGLFFKLRSYLTSKNQVEVCPLILSRQVQFLDGLTGADPIKEPSSFNWAMVAYLALLPLAATWIAWRIYQTTRRSPRRSSKASSIAANGLNDLRRESAIQSTRERLSKMANDQKDRDE